AGERPAVWRAMEAVSATLTVSMAFTPPAFSRATSQPTCRSCSRPSSNWSSTPRPPRRLGSPCRHRCSHLASLCTHNEAVLLNGGVISVTDYVAMTATLARLLRLLGLRRVPREVESLATYLEHTYASQPETGEAA